MNIDPIGDCMCDWQACCHGTGLVECAGCGGDQCVCVCGGHAIDCAGCDECPDRGDEGYEECR